MLREKGGLGPGRDGNLVGAVFSLSYKVAPPLGSFKNFVRLTNKRGHIGGAEVEVVRGGRDNVRGKEKVRCLALVAS